MGRYVARRLLLTIPVLLGASFLIFGMVYALPGDPIRALAGDRPVSPAVVEVLRQRFHLDDPLWVQYWEYLKGLFRGDLGTDFRGRPVLDTIERTLPVTVNRPSVDPIVEPEPRVTGPAKVLMSDTLRSAPAAAAPIPFSVTGSNAA